MRCFRLGRKDLQDLYKAGANLPKTLTVYEDGTAYADTYADSCAWDNDFFYPEDETFQQCAADFSTKIEG